MNDLSTNEIAELIYDKISADKTNFKNTYQETKDHIGYFYIDNILPEYIAKKCFDVFPKKSEMRVLKSIREYKFVSAQMDKHNTFLEQIIYAFQDPRIVKLIGEICEIDNLFADEFLYAGGISLMDEGNFLHPHLDNSHDVDRERWRVLNLLYYITPNWETENGGHLELWPNGPKKKPIVLESKYNRLIVMATHCKSWHSVNKVRVDNKRCCISNYYFSDMPLKESDNFHVTKFRGRPEDLFTNIILGLDSNLRMLVRRIFKKGIRKNPHIYKKNE